MKNGFYGPKIMTAAHKIDEIVVLAIIGEIAVRQIEAFSPFLEIINDQNIGNASRVEAGDQVAANKAGATSNYDHIVPMYFNYSVGGPALGSAILDGSVLDIRLARTR